MARETATVVSSRLLTVATITLVVAVLYLAQAMLLPVALAILFSFLLAPLVTRLERLGANRIFASISVVSVTFAMLLGMIVLFSTQIVQFTTQLPQYQSNFEAKLLSVKPAVQRAVHSLESLREKLNSAPTAIEPDTQTSAEATANESSPALPPVLGPPADDRTIPVKVVETATSPLEILRDWLGPILSPLATAAIVTVFVVFMLIEREDLRNRAIVLLGERNLRETTHLLDDASARVGRYLRMQVLINLGYGVAITLGLWLLGMPNAPLWGLLAFVSRFVPYIGTWAGSLIPIALSLAVFDGWTRPLAIVALYGALEFIGGNVIEPWLFGATTGLSSVGVVLSAFFWTWLWGTPGLVLATPLTVCLTAWGRYLPQLRFLNVLLSDEPVLAPSARVYQRLLSFDFDEASDLVSDYNQTHTLIETCDDVLLPTLVLVERDRHENSLDADAQAFVLRSLRELVADLEPDSAATAVPATEEATAAKQPSYSLLCLPARDEADEIAAEMVKQAWQALGNRAEVLSITTLISERVSQAEEHDYDVVCVSAVPPFAMLHARYLCRRLRPRMTRGKLVVGLWQTSTSGRARTRLDQTGVDAVGTSLAQAIDQLKQLAGSKAAPNSSEIRKDAAEKIAPAVPLAAGH